MCVTARTILLFAAILCVAFAPGLDAPQAIAAGDAIEETPLEPSSDQRLAVAPAVFSTRTVDPESTLRLDLLVRNYTSMPQRIRGLVLPLTGSEDASSLATPEPEAERSATAAGWVRSPLDTPVRVAASTQLVVPITIAVPSDAPPGAYALALGVTTRISPPKPGGVDANDAHVAASAAPMSRLVFSVSGDASSAMEIERVEAPRIVWSGSTERFVAVVRNTGDTLLDADGEVQLGAFVGTARRTLAADAQAVLPGGVRVLQMDWTDPPLVGRFESDLVVVGGEGSGVRIKRDLPAVWVLPPWWLVVAVIAALALPIAARRRRRRRQRR